MTTTTTITLALVPPAGPTARLLPVRLSTGQPAVQVTTDGSPCVSLAAEVGGRLVDGPATDWGSIEWQVEAWTDEHRAIARRYVRACSGLGGYAPRATQAALGCDRDGWE